LPKIQAAYFLKHGRHILTEYPFGVSFEWFYMVLYARWLTRLVHSV